MARLMALLLVTVLATGCVAAPSGAPTGAGAEIPGLELAAVTVDRLPGTAADAAAAGAAINAFGLAVYWRIAEGDAAGNLVVSPTSIALALAMARAGARGQTATEMDAVLRDLGTDEHAAWVAAIDALLNSRTATYKDDAGAPQDVVLRIVNAPFAQRGLTLQPAYLEALSARFGAGLRLVDYATQAEAARTAINAWVKANTEGRIPELLAAGDVDGSTLLVLVNAIYLHAAWLTPFPESLTAPAVFTLPDGTTVSVPMMRTTHELGYAAGDGWRAVEIPYVGGMLAMDVILPDDLTTFEAGFDERVLGTITSALAPATVTLGLPRWSTGSRFELGPVLADLGMPSAFGAADFSGITTAAALQIAAVIHQANIDVDEKGTTAAAATAVILRESAGPGATVELTVDHPFLFVLRDLETGVVLFLGRVADPWAAPAGAGA